MANVQLAIAGDETTQVILSVPGVQGPAGSNLPPSGSTHQLLYKQSNTDYDTAWKLLTNDNVDAAAAIAGTKISPNFGSQNVVTTGTSTAASFIPTSSSVPANGLYLPSANNVAISTSGTGRLFVDASGNVILGTTSILSGATGRVLQIGATTDSASTLQFAATTTGNSYIQFGDGGSPESYAGYLQYTHTDNALLFGTNKTERLRITSTGTVNIIGAGTAGSTQAVSFNGSAPVDSLVLTSGGLVGIGTSSPSEVIHVVGNGRVGNNTTNPTFTVVSSNTSNPGANTRVGTIKFAANANNVADITAERNCGITATTGSDERLTNLDFYTSTVGGGAARVRIDSSGNVGIGTTPSETLHVNGSARLGTTSHVFYANNIACISSSADTTIDASSAQLIFKSGGGEAARLDASKRLLVGTSSSPSVGYGQYARVVIQGYTGNANEDGALSLQRGEAAANITSGDNIGRMAFNDNAGNSFADILCSADADAGAGDYPGRLVFSTNPGAPATGPVERFLIGNAGRLYATCNDTANASLTLRKGAAGADGIDYLQCRDSANTAQLVIASNGNVQNTNGSYTTLSDAKLKENIVDASSQWDDLKSIKIRNWNFKTETGYQTHRQIGPIAQELETVCPNLVFDVPDRNESGEDIGTVTKGVNQSVLYMKAVKALQEAMERIEALEQRLNDAGIN